MAARQVALDCEAADLKSLDIELEDDDRDVCHHLALLSKHVYEVYMTEVSVTSRCASKIIRSPVPSKRYSRLGSDGGYLFGSVAAALSFSY